MIILLIVLVLLGAFAVGAEADLLSDTWVATDALGRKLPGYDECGPPRKGKVVGIFYFLWSGYHGTGGPYDITKITAANPDNPQWGPPGAFHHWGETEIGYYLSKDEWVIRRHCSMLVDAGVDVLIFDVTNGFTYDAEYLTLCQVFTQIRSEGGRTPQFCFIANSGSDSVVQRLYDNFYSKNLYPELWFRWHGKPLIMASPERLGEPLRSFFTFRQSWAWHDPNGWFGDGRDKWPWLDSYPQAFGWHEPSKPEAMAVCVAQHPTTNIGRSFHDGKQPAAADFRTDEGLCFAEQWRRALEVDPEFLFITGWNEWVAQRFLSDGNATLCGRKLEKGETFFVDAYNQEYSRDIEPMKGGHTDNYYYQMIAGIRRFKGVRPPQPAGPARTIRIDGDFSQWASVQPEYRDTLGDTQHRNSQGWGENVRYINTTGRNDIVMCKVARDAVNVYFYVQTRGNLTPHTDRNWMLLFIDADQDASTGWNGYDFLVNSPVIDDKMTTLKRWSGGAWKRVGTVAYWASGNALHLAIPRAALGMAGDKPVSLDFHWADNMQRIDDIIEFSISGDSAPNRRFNYRYKADR